MWLRPLLLVPAFAIILLEETVWRWARALGALLARIPLFTALERLVARLHAYLVLALFLIPIALLFPIKLAALYFIARGHVIAGFAVIIAAKMFGTALSARLYAIAEPRLLEIPLFIRLHGLVTRLLAQAHAYLAASPAWQAAGRAVAQGKAALRRVKARYVSGGAFAAVLASLRHKIRPQR